MPKVVNVGDVRRVVRGPALLHIRPEQWKLLLKGVKETKTRPRRTGALEFSPMPGQKGIMLAARASQCQFGCDDVFQHSGSSKEDFQKIWVDCDCDGVGIAPPSRSSCRIGIRVGSPTGELSITSLAFICVDGHGNACADAEPAWFRTPQGGFLLACQKK